MMNDKEEVIEEKKEFDSARYRANCIITSISGNIMRLKNRNGSYNCGGNYDKEE